MMGLNHDVNWNVNMPHTSNSHISTETECSRRHFGQQLEMIRTNSDIAMSDEKFANERHLAAFLSVSDDGIGNRAAKSVSNNCCRTLLLYVVRYTLCCQPRK